jgi:hypothetical protein
MTSQNLTKAQRELVAFLLDGKATRNSRLLSEWIVSSKRYAAFANTYKDKIRKKLRVTQADAMADLMHELRIPYLLLQDKRFEVAYEPYASAKVRSADYAITYRSNFTFDIEITHLRSLHITAAPDGEAIDARLIDVICAKLSQLQANMANILLVACPESSAGQLDPAAHLAWLRSKAEGGNAAFYARYGFKNAAGFFKLFERLSALVLLAPKGTFAMEQNSRARVRLPREVQTALQRSFVKQQ